jgi:8-oxo-dGDP phosphatase
VEVASGAVEHDEEPLPAAHRELREELGLIADTWTDLGMFDLDTSIVRCPVRLFLARALRTTTVDPDPTERIRRVTVSLDDAVTMVLNGEITHAPSCFLILKAERTIRCGSGAPNPAQA